ncbi:M20 metallopeptidase family protein [Oceanivirga salmonicida]|uniref:M20 metallopeptidase family protein n=1 Tax=Oceanivirga salmonicida TaxID=1769291 RepID=UPI000836EE65|nr:M20 family metallopeptidase [Oceanivirga salmonicida]
MNKNEYILNLIDKIEKNIIEIRKNLHKYPELSDKEFKTKNMIIKFLEENGVEYKEVLETGIHAYIKNGTGKKMAFRADMDALPIIENNELEYKSKNVGVMHACGHDIHMSVQLGLILALLNSKDKWGGTANFYFQPAEETVGGAKRMLEAGVNKDKNDRILAFHSAPELKVGKIGIKYGKMHATSAVFKLNVIGRPAHAALAYQGIDSIVIASKVVDYLQTIVSRKIDGRNAAVITVGTFNAGTAENIVADNAELTGTIRTLDQETKKYIVNILNNELKDYVKSYGAKLEVEIRDSYAPVINDKEFTKYFEENTKDILGENSIEYIEQTRMDVEDFGFFLEEITGTFYRLGVSPIDKENTTLHTDTFIADSNAVRVGMIASYKTALEFLCIK